MTLISDLFSPGVATIEGVPGVADEALFPEELHQIRTAREGRRADFATARVLARRALRTLGVEPTPLVCCSSGAPMWPAGVVGSITHTLEYCAVALGRAADFSSMGLDAERVRILEGRIADLVLTPRELRWLATQPTSERNDLLVLMFSAKEAFYKCQYPVTGAFLEFKDAELDIDRDAMRFAVTTLQNSLLQMLPPLMG